MYVCVCLLRWHTRLEACYASLTYLKHNKFRRFVYMLSWHKCLVNDIKCVIHVNLCKNSHIGYSPPKALQKHLKRCIGLQVK